MAANAEFHWADPLLIDQQLTVLHGVPAMYAKVIEWSRANGQSLRTPSLRMAQSGGAFIPVHCGCGRFGVGGRREARGCLLSAGLLCS